MDIAVIDADSFSGNQLKTFIKRLAKDMSADLNELVVPNVTSKGSRFYKAIYQYPNLVGLTSSAVKAGQILIEVNTYANPYPYTYQEISSFLTEYLMTIGRVDLIEEYDLKPFSINVLDKQRTIVEKLVSLFRFSFEADTIKSLSSKIRHFYDLYYLINDDECYDYIQSPAFQSDFQELFIHDQQQFSEPDGWCTKTVKDSPLFKDFQGIWMKLSPNYRKELTPLAFSEIPNEMLIAENFIKVLNNLLIQ
nr:nucleotidyl transferase AbiEii/AbiGii toxin family protein [uncultured Prevotella sp.]